MIELNNIDVIYNKESQNEVHALRSINLTVNKNDFLVLVGSNGSGKSTLLNVLAGTIKVNSGSIKIDNTDITNLSDFEKSKFIARIFQNPLSGTSPDLTILENFRLAYLRTKPKNIRIGINKDFADLVHDKIKLLGMNLETKLNQTMGSLSGGQRQALTLIMAIMDDCKILLLDEPTAALDPKSSGLVLEKANEIISENKLCAILVTHQMKEAIKYGNRIIQLKEGKIVNDLDVKQKETLTINELVDWF